MAKLTRRGMLTLAVAGVGEVAALTAAAATGAHFAPAPAVTTTTRSTTGSRVDISQGPLAAFVPDAKSDTIVIMRGEKEMTITDPALVRALLSLTSL